MAIFFTSDTHYWHSNVIRYCNRPYSKVEDMNEDMVNRWNSVVKPEDYVYMLGDFSLNFRSIESYSFRLYGQRCLIPGNHDLCHSFHKKSRHLENREKWIQKYKDYGWNVLPEQTTLDIPGIATFNLCHHPYSEESKDFHDKYEKWRPIDNGRILLHGHIHEKGLFNRSSKGTPMVNVGVDVWNFTPVSIDGIVELLKKNDAF